MDSSWIKYIEVSVTILTFVFAVIITTLIGLKNTKNENRITVITKKRLVTHDNIRKAVQDINTYSDPQYLISCDCHNDCILHLFEAFSLLRINLHAGYHMDMILIKKGQRILDDVLSLIRSSEQKAEDIRALNIRRHEFINLVDIYLTTEWRRIKKEIRKVSDYGDDWDKDFLDSLLYNYCENTITPCDKERQKLKDALHSVALYALRKSKQAEKDYIIDTIKNTVYCRNFKFEVEDINQAIEDLQQFGVVEHTSNGWKVVAYNLDEFE